MRGRRPAAALMGLLLLAACASDGPRAEGSRLSLGGPGRDRERFNHADPSKVIAAELAFARAAQEKGQWTAFAEYATDDAVMFVPQVVNAKAWLRQQANPAQAVRWQPHQVWSSCDGTLAVTRGAWQRPDGSVGYFTTVWERQKNGEYKWVLDQGDTLAQPLEAPEMVSASVAECTPKPNSAAALAAVAATDRRSGWAKDETLIYSTDVRADGSRTITVRRWNGNSYEEAMRSEVAPPA